MLKNLEKTWYYNYQLILDINKYWTKYKSCKDFLKVKLQFVVITHTVQQMSQTSYH